MANTNLQPSQVTVPTKLIPLSQGKFAIVDKADFEWLSQWKWHYHNGYAKRTQWDGVINGKRTTHKVWLHREVNKTPKGFHTDHVNGDPLDNRRENLRKATPVENTRNSKMPSDNTSGYKGVRLHKHLVSKPWSARIANNRVTKHLGCFATPQEAYAVYAQAAKELHGEYYRECKL